MDIFKQGISYFRYNTDHSACQWEKLLKCWTCGLEISTDQSNILLAMDHQINVNLQYWFIYPFDGQIELYVISPFFIYDLITSYMYLEVGAFVLSKETGFKLILHKE